MNAPFDAFIAQPSDRSRCFADDASAQMELLVTDFGRMYQERNDALQEVARAHHDALLRLARAAEFRDGDTGEHILRIGEIAGAIALKLGQPAEWAHLVRQAAPMHDIGKIGIPDEVLKKPGPLAAEERRVMNQHARIGADILGRSRIPLFRLAAEIALTHHERWDGAGYPQGLAGEAIPLSGRIVAVADFFDALTMDRCYRPAFTPGEALDLVRAQRGRALDPRIVDVFVEHADELLAIRAATEHEYSGFAELAGVPSPSRLLPSGRFR